MYVRDVERESGKERKGQKHSAKEELSSQFVPRMYHLCSFYTPVAVVGLVMHYTAVSWLVVGAVVLFIASFWPFLRRRNFLLVNALLAFSCTCVSL